MNGNIECECVVKKDKKVKKGTVIGIRKDIDFPILSPVSGTVVDIKTCTYLNGETVPCVVIENDKLEKVVKKELVKDITIYSKEEFVELLRKCSVTGMGGSDFPTFLKYKCDLNTLVVNAVECEPYITADAMLVKLKADILLETIDAIMKINKIKKCYIAYKENNSVVKDAFLEYIGKYKKIELSHVKNMYPMGWERHIIKSVLNIEYDKYPSEKGIVINNVSTIFAIYKALKYQRNISKRLVTITGEGFTDPVNVLAKVGAKMNTIVKKIGKYKGSELKFIAGGPMMGNSLSKDNVVVTNALGAITILEHVEDEINECMGCGRCLKVCPANICPIFILESINDKEKLKKLHPEKCIECGACSYICPSKIGLRDAVKIAKKKVSK
jgi:electron transport complex protein RnfC